MYGAPSIYRSLGRAARGIGKAMDALGMSLQEKPQMDRLVASARVVAFKGKETQYADQCYIASTAATIGDVKLGDLSSVWYGASVRGDQSSVSIGKNSSIMDNSTVVAKKNTPVKVGENVTISPGAYVESATIGNNVIIGMGAQVHAGAKIGDNCFIDAGAVVASGTEVPSGELWTGRPARFLRKLTPEEIAYLQSSATVTSELSQVHFSQSSLSAEEFEFQQQVRLLKLEDGFAPDAPIVEPDEDVVRYYELTKGGPNDGLFRTHEYDVAAERAIQEAEEVAADAAEEEFYALLAQQRRIGEAFRVLSATRADRPGARENVINELGSRDPQAADFVMDVLHDIAQLEANPDPEHKEKVLRTILNFQTAIHADYDDRANEAAATYDALAKHSKAMGLLEEKKEE